MEKLLISACLVGINCKYSGGNNALPEETLCKLKEKYSLVPVCPETAGGLGVPRDPSERRGNRVVSIRGRDVTAEYRRGGEVAVCLVRRFDCKKALLKERSPSCGSGEIYDGSFTGTPVRGYGVAAEMLKEAGVNICGESETEKIM